MTLSLTSLSFHVFFFFRQHFIPAWLRPKTDIPRLPNGRWLRPVKRREGIFKDGDKERGLCGSGTVHFTEVAERVWLLELTDFEVLNPRNADLWFYLCPRTPSGSINDRFLDRCDRLFLDGGRSSATPLLATDVSVAARGRFVRPVDASGRTHTGWTCLL